MPRCDPRSKAFVADMAMSLPSFARLGNEWRIDMMWQDSIVEETRQLRRQYASGFENDPDAIFEDIPRRQNESKKKLGDWS